MAAHSQRQWSVWIGIYWLNQCSGTSWLCIFSWMWKSLNWYRSIFFWGTGPRVFPKNLEKRHLHENNLNRNLRDEHYPIHGHFIVIFLEHFKRKKYIQIQFVNLRLAVAFILTLKTRATPTFCKVFNFLHIRKWSRHMSKEASPPTQRCTVGKEYRD